MTGNNLKLLAVDLDGTFLDNSHELTDSNAAAFRAAQSHATCIVATGRGRRSAMDAIGEEQAARAGLRYYPGVFLSGGIVYGPEGPEDIILERSLAREVVRAVEVAVGEYAASSGHRLALVAGRRDDVYLAESNEYWETFARRWKDPPPQKIGRFADYLAADESRIFGKMTILADPSTVEDLTKTLIPQLQKSFDFDIVVPLDCLIDIMPKGNNKGNALKVLMTRLGLKGEEVMVMGDSNNDKEMFQIEGITSVAMGNAPMHVKKCAKFVTLDNTKDGVAVAIFDHFAFSHSDLPAA